MASDIIAAAAAALLSSSSPCLDPKRTEHQTNNLWVSESLPRYEASLTSKGLDLGQEGRGRNRPSAHRERGFLATMRLVVGRGGDANILFSTGHIHSLALSASRITPPAYVTRVVFQRYSNWLAS